MEFYEHCATACLHRHHHGYCHNVSTMMLAGLLKSKVWCIEVWLRSELMSWQLSQCHDDMQHVVASWETVCSQHYSLCYPTRRQVTPGCIALFFWPPMRTLPPQPSLLCPQALAFILLLTHFFFTWGGNVWLLKCYTLQLHWHCILWSIGVGDSGDTGEAAYGYLWWRLVTLVKQPLPQPWGFLLSLMGKNIL